MRTHPSPGFSTILALAIALVILGAAIVGILAYGSGNQPAMPTVNASASTSDSIVKLMCAQDAECAAYCGLDSCYTPFCDGTKHCACNYTCEPVPAGNADTSAAVTDFTSCAAAGNPVQESYPRKCSAGGVTFTEVLANANGNAALNTYQSSNTNTVVKSTTLQKLRTDDRYVYYSGSITVSGKYKELEPTTLLGGQLCFYADAETGYLIPRDPNLWGEGNADTRLPWFCFKDQATAKTLFGINDDVVFRDTAVACIQGKATVEVSNYVVDKLESEVFDTAELGSIVAKDAFTTSCE